MINQGKISQMLSVFSGQKNVFMQMSQNILQ